MYDWSMYGCKMLSWSLENMYWVLLYVWYCIGCWDLLGKSVIILFVVFKVYKFIVSYWFIGVMLVKIWGIERDKNREYFVCFREFFLRGNVGLVMFIFYFLRMLEILWGFFFFWCEIFMFWMLFNLKIVFLKYCIG